MTMRLLGGMVDGPVPRGLLGVGSADEEWRASAAPVAPYRAFAHDE